MKKSKSPHALFAAKIREEILSKAKPESWNVAETLRRWRMDKKLSGVDLCRKAGDLDPRTLTALEKGRIRNPSIKTLQSVARGLGITLSDLFRRFEMHSPQHFYLGSQRGDYQLEFPKAGLTIVSFTPFMHHFFCGKFILKARRMIDSTLLNHPAPLYLSSLVGRFQVTVEEKEVNLKEGDNLFFGAGMRYTLHNPLQREAVLLVVTAPSFI